MSIAVGAIRLAIEDMIMRTISVATTIVALAAISLLRPAAAQQAATAAVPVPALKGLDPVLLADGSEKPGREDLAVQQGQYLYRFATEGNLATFRADPTHYEIQFGGGCARMGPLSGLGDPDRFHVHDGRIYIFASDACREGFKKRTELFFDPDTACPKADAGALQRGRDLLDRVLAAHGGVARLRAVRSFRFERSVTKGEVTQAWRVFVGFPDRIRIEQDYTQSNQSWHYAKVATATVGFFLNEGEARPMHASGRREMRRTALREPLFALRHAAAGNVVAIAGAKTVVHGVAVEPLVLWCDGVETTFGIGQDGRIATASYRGRGPQLWFGSVEHVFGDYVERSGIMTPQKVTAYFDGARAEANDEQRTAVSTDGELAEELFTVPR
ncbi:MAG: hypothetical protein KDC98_02500 [Planctomycetes bacterium]|nr:hypothetical protein [Planctomycetota bacterium]